MKTIVVHTEAQEMRIQADCFYLDEDSVIHVIRNHATIAMFREWDDCYEEENEEEPQEVICSCKCPKKDQQCFLRI